MKTFKVHDMEAIIGNVLNLKGYKGIISNSLLFLKSRRKEVFLYLQDPMVEKTSDIAE